MSPLLEACALSHVYPDGSVGLDGCSLTMRRAVGASSVSKAGRLSAASAASLAAIS